MGMFDNYNNQNTDYIPNNLGYAGKRPMAYPIPYVEYNAEGEQSGYYWYYGDTVNLIFELTGEVTQEDSLTYIPASDYISGMIALIKIYNFRFEEVYSEEFEAADETTLSIGRELSEKLVKGTYYITFTLIDKTTNVWNYIPIFRDKECVITVK